jgi:hypothetical protein
MTMLARPSDTVVSSPSHSSGSAPRSTGQLKKVVTRSTRCCCPLIEAD